MTRRNFEGKTVIVTGAARGLGRALCRRFGAAGARVGGLDVAAGELTATFDALAAEGVTAASAVCDLVDEAATCSAVGRLREAFGPVDALIANAGVTHVRRFAAGEAAAVRRVTEINFFGAVHAVAAAFDDLVDRRGLIVAVSSVAGYAPLSGRTGYAASKHAVEGFFATLRAELHGTGAGVLVVRPSFIATSIGDSGGGRRTFGAEDRPEDVAEAIFRAACRGRRHLATGRVGRLSWWLQRASPRLYEALMRRTMD